MEFIHNQFLLNQSNIVKDMLSLYIFLSNKCNNIKLPQHLEWFSAYLMKRSQVYVMSLWIIPIHPYNLSAVLRMSIVILQNHKKIAIYSNNIVRLWIRSVGMRIRFFATSKCCLLSGATNSLDNPESLLHRNHTLTNLNQHQQQHTNCRLHQHFPHTKNSKLILNTNKRDTRIYGFSHNGIGEWVGLMEMHD